MAQVYHCQGHKGTEDLDWHNILEYSLNLFCSLLRIYDELFLENIFSQLIITNFHTKLLPLLLNDDDVGDHVHDHDILT